MVLLAIYYVHAANCVNARHFQGILLASIDYQENMPQ